jgi:hypothetical protein
MKGLKTKKELSSELREELLRALQARFEKKEEVSAESMADSHR